jgi:hypothetical protein
MTKVETVGGQKEGSKESKDKGGREKRRKEKKNWGEKVKCDKKELGKLIFGKNGKGRWVTTNFLKIN